jgi:hypothetical protein
MNIILDECVDVRFAREIPDHSVTTVQQAGWAGVQNGELLRLVEQQFDVFVTVDRNLAFQQNIPQFNLIVIVLYAQTNRLADLKALVPDLLAVLPNAPKGQVTRIGT